MGGDAVAIVGRLEPWCAKGAMFAQAWAQRSATDGDDRVWRGAGLLEHSRRGFTVPTVEGVPTRSLGVETVGVPWVRYSAPRARANITIKRANGCSYDE